MTDASAAPSPTTAEKAAALAALHVPGDPLIVVNVSWLATRSPATSANRYEGLGQGSCHSAQ